MSLNAALLLDQGDDHNKDANVTMPDISGVGLRRAIIQGPAMLPVDIAGSKIPNT